jgi:hypothetical protein
LDVSDMQLHVDVPLVVAGWLPAALRAAHMSSSCACCEWVLWPLFPPLVLVLALWAQVVDAVAYLHSLGIMHRDIKPENCLLAKPARHYATKAKPVKVRLAALVMLCHSQLLHRQPVGST